MIPRAAVCASALDPRTVPRQLQKQLPDAG
jgi:hypothetical protein